MRFKTLSFYFLLFLSFSFQSLAQVGSLEEIIRAGRDGSQPEYIGRLMSKFEAKLKRFVIDKNPGSPKEILNLFGAVAGVLTYMHSSARIVGYATPGNFFHWVGERSPLCDVCEVLKTSWTEILNDKSAILRDPRIDTYGREFLEAVFAESLLLSENELATGATVEQARSVRYRFAEWKVLNDMLEHAAEFLEKFYSFPKFEWYEKTHWRPTENHPHPNCDNEWCECSYYLAMQDQTGWYEEVPNGVITNPMETPAAWLAFRQTHFDSLSQDAWVFLAPWIEVIDALMYRPAIVLFNLGQRDPHSPIGMLPAEMRQLIGSFVAPSLYRK